VDGFARQRTLEPGQFGLARLDRFVAGRGGEGRCTERIGSHLRGARGQVMRVPEDIGQHALGHALLPAKLADAQAEVARHDRLRGLFQVAIGYNLVDTPGLRVGRHVAAGLQRLDGVENKTAEAGCRVPLQVKDLHQRAGA